MIWVVVCLVVLPGLWLLALGLCKCAADGDSYSELFFPPREDDPTLFLDELECRAAHPAGKRRAQ